ncbi:BgTH12-03119 [Blumeria graminis f. sp. triticale]|uniref:BgtE-5993 n=3 Tax=Blumeria graminis TaxID=34373 RepID=A0A381LIV8_BLUGR|nr:putative secreted effector protein [Blumeria graminis f. sp. tritici 96224]CAD6503455.1 BgTH12-03119 [Blumeria graminis f. sp. triticale]VDB89546.1 BgtE-5993 [Blumeria graminis f. sp. tritici]
MRLISSILLAAFLSTQVFAEPGAEAEKSPEIKVQTFSCGKILKVKSSNIQNALQFINKKYEKASGACQKKSNCLKKWYYKYRKYDEYTGNSFSKIGKDDILLRKSISVKTKRRRFQNRFYVIARCSPNTNCQYKGIVRKPYFRKRDFLCHKTIDGKMASKIPDGFPQPSAPTSPDGKEIEVVPLTPKPAFSPSDTSKSTSNV